MAIISITIYEWKGKYKVKIVQIITRMDVIGGAQVHVLELTKGLIEKGHEVIIISSGCGIMTEQLKELSIPYYAISELQVKIHPWKDIRTLRKLKKLIKVLNPELIAVHSSKAGILGRLAGRALKIPTVFTAHSWSFANIKNPLKRWAYIMIERMISRVPAGIISVSEYDHQLAVKYLKPSYIQGKVIHNGIHTNKAVLQSAQDSKSVKLVMVARFAEPKDHQLLLEALSLLPNEIWHLTLAGDGPLLPSIKQKAKQLGLKQQIAFLGEIKDIQSVLSKADIFLLISNSEGLPISIIEAMQARLAIIATDVGGVSELIQHHKNGLLIPKEISMS